jgi:hypothetical protein
MMLISEKEARCHSIIPPFIAWYIHQSNIRMRNNKDTVTTAEGKNKIL